MAVMTNTEFVKKIKSVAENYKTLYVMGCFGAPMNATNKTRYCSNHSYNKQSDRQKMIQAASADTFGFDCVCLIKGVLWGWNGDKTKTYGGAKYESNGVPDIDANSMITKCSNVSTDFSKIEVGEVVWMQGHIGVYIGNGLVVESSPKWKNCVQITACNCTKSGYNRRDWTKHGKLPYIIYNKVEEKPETNAGASNVNIALDVCKKGSKGEQVKTIQRILYAMGYKDQNGKALSIDGDFGSKTDYALRSFQTANKLAADGFCGSATWSALLK